MVQMIYIFVIFISTSGFTTNGQPGSFFTVIIILCSSWCLPQAAWSTDTKQQPHGCKINDLLYLAPSDQ